MRIIQKSVFVLSALAIVSCKSSRSSEEASSPGTPMGETEILKCQVTNQGAFGQEGKADVWDLSIKMDEKFITILYTSAGSDRSESSIRYTRIKGKNPDSFDDTRLVFNVASNADFFGGGGPRVIERPNDQNVAFPIGEFFNSLTPSKLILTARKDENFKLAQAAFGVQYKDVNKDNEEAVFTHKTTNCISNPTKNTIEKFGQF